MQSTSSAKIKDRATVAVHRNELRAVLGADFVCSVLLETNAHEGPVYVAAEHALYFTTVPDPVTTNNAIMRLRLANSEFPFTVQALDTIRRPANMANGMCLDREGHLVICEQGTTETHARIACMDIEMGDVRTLVDKWNGVRFNSPNDVVVKSDGTLWFTDPNYGELQGFKGKALLGSNVYRHDPATTETVVVTDDFDKPNGLAFSPDESVLYVTDSGAIQGAGTYCPERPHHVRAFDVVGGRELRNSRLFAVVSPGIPDGIKVDQEGRVYTSSATGVQVFTPEGDRMGEIMTPGAANFTFGGPGNYVLFILGDTKIWQVRLQARGL
jgi:gluconolactonase